MKKINMKKAGIVGLYFGAFQGGMPVIGYLLGVQFQNKITSFDHWIAFILLALIGIKMLKESRESSCEVALDSLGANNEANSLSFKNMSVLAIATSIDALAVGVTFAFLNVSIAPAASFIGIVTFTLSMVGVMIGNVFGEKFKSKAEFAGGFILVLMGIKILFEHIGLINF